MNKILLAATILLISNFAFAENLRCTISVSTEVVTETTFNIEANKEVMFAESDNYRFFISNKANSKFELEIYDNDGPSRSYATGYLRSESDDLTWTLWTRDILLETSCKIAL